MTQTTYNFDTIAELAEELYDETDGTRGATAELVADLEMVSLIIVGFKNKTITSYLFPNTPQSYEEIERLTQVLESAGLTSFESPNATLWDALLSYLRIWEVGQTTFE